MSSKTILMTQLYNFLEAKRLIALNSEMEGVNCSLQVKVAGHCFTIADKTQALTNATTRLKK